MTKKKVFIIAGTVIVIVVVIFALAGLIFSGMLSGKKEELVADAPPVVTVENPQVRSIEIPSDLIGTIEPSSMVQVMPRGSGEVTAVNVQPGDMVTSGQVLFVIDTKLIESSAIQVETNRITYENARKNLERMSVLYAAGDMAEADYQSLKNSVETARLQYENTKIAYDLQVENSQVTAPIGGKLESFDISVHDMVSPQTPAGVIAGEGGNAVTFYVSERIVGGLKARDNISIEKNGTVYEAVITEVSTMVDEASGLFKVKASVPEGGGLAAGTSVKLTVVSQRAENVLTVPVESVYYEGGAPFVYTYADGALKRNAVTAGLADNDYAEIQDGITIEDQVVTTWTSELYDGSKVTLAKESEEEPQTVHQNQKKQGMKLPVPGNKGEEE